MSEKVTWGEQAYAGFWLRLVALWIDGLILGVIGMVFAFFLAPPVLFDPIDPATFELRPGYFSAVATFAGVSWLVWIIYDTVLHSWQGWTLGKRVVGVEVRSSDGASLSFGKALVRALVKYTLSYWVLYLGFLWAAWDPRKQTWHDKLAGSYALRRSWLQPAGQGPAQAVQPALTATPQPGTAQHEAPHPPAPGAGQQTSAGLPGEWGIPVKPAASPPSPPPAAEPPPVEPQPAPVEPEPERPPVEPEPERPPVEPEPLRPPVEPEPEPAPPPVEPQPGPIEPEPAADPAQPEPAGPSPQPGHDPNRVAITRAGIGEDTAAWLSQVAEQVDPRLDRVAPSWRTAPQAAAARACAFGLLIGHLAQAHPHMGSDLAQVAEVHPSFSTLAAGNRLATLQQIAQNPARATAWLGPLIGVQDSAHLRHLFD